MRLDPKYFTLFITICGAVTLFVIFYGTVRYSQNQETQVRENITEMRLDQVRLPVVDMRPGREETEEADANVLLSEFRGRTVLIAFWSTWSGKSRKDHAGLYEMAEKWPEVRILAASVRDDTGLIQEYVESRNYDFIWVEGTDLYHELQIPGIPSYLLIDRKGNFHDLQVGEGIPALKDKLKSLLNHGTD